MQKMKHEEGPWNPLSSTALSGVRKRRSINWLTEHFLTLKPEREFYVSQNRRPSVFQALKS